jgi:hypothetical protein
MNVYGIISGLIGFSVYIPLCILLLRKQVKQNFASWFLWVIIDLIVTGSLIMQGGSWHLSAIYVTGSSITCLCILRSKIFHWGRFETFIATLVVICLVIWKCLTPEWATVASTIATVIAGIPVQVEAYRKPQDQPLLSYIGFALANGLGIAAGNAWTISERLFPTACFPFSVLLVIFTLRRYLKGHA